MIKVDLSTNYIVEKYRQHLTVYGTKKFPVAKAKALEIVMIVEVMFGIGAMLWFIWLLPRNTFNNSVLATTVFSFFAGIMCYVYQITLIGVKRYWLAYRAVQVFTDPRKPVVYLRAFRADDVVESQQGRRDYPAPLFYMIGEFHKWLTGFPNPMASYSVEEDIAPYFRRLGPFLSIGRPTQFAPMIGSTRIYVEDGYWQAVVLDLIAIAELVIVRADISSGLSWEIEQVFRNISVERIILILTDRYANPYTREEYEKLLSMFPQNARTFLPNALDNAWYIYFKPDGTSCTVSKGEGISKITKATEALLKAILSDQKILVPEGNLVPDNDEDMLSVAALIILVLGLIIVFFAMVVHGGFIIGR